MARTLNQVLATLPVKRRAKIEGRASELATLKDLRQAIERTQEELAVSLGVGQDTISRIERRSDMLLSTLRRYVEAMGGKLELVAEFPDRPRMVIDQLTPAREKSPSRSQAKAKLPAKPRPSNKRHAATA
jgi:transcriptional regulator with XRE-family HTH domain